MCRKAQRSLLRKDDMEGHSASSGPELHTITLTVSFPRLGCVLGEVATKRVRMTYVGHCQMKMLESNLMKEQSESSSLGKSSGGLFQCAVGPGF